MVALVSQTLSEIENNVWICQKMPQKQFVMIMWVKVELFEGENDARKNGNQIE